MAEFWCEDGFGNSPSRPDTELLLPHQPVIVISEKAVMLIIHPIVQFMAILVSIFALYLGINRFRLLHLGQKVMFKWKWYVS